jgi:hypothetical protein
MPINHRLADILDDTVAALSHLNSTTLDSLEQRIVALAESDEVPERDAVGLLLKKKRLLEIVLQNCQVNLNALTRLHARNVRNQWAQ